MYLKGQVFLFDKK